jgi:hypothetical protein
MVFVPRLSAARYVNHPNYNYCVGVQRVLERRLNGARRDLE